MVRVEKVNEYPVVFHTGEEVRAVLAGRKTQFRWPIDPQPDEDGLAKLKGQWIWHDTGEREYAFPYGPSGQRLWVKEAWGVTSLLDYYPPSRLIDEWARAGRSEPPRVFYAATEELPSLTRRPVLMPDWAARIFLEVTGVGVERIQAISKDDIRAEGINSKPQRLRQNFMEFWNTYHTKRGLGWDANPWVGVAEFRRVKP